MSLLYDFIIQFSIIISILLFLFSKGYFLIKKFKYLKFLNLSPIIGYSILIVEINFYILDFSLIVSQLFYQFWDIVIFSFQLIQLQIKIFLRIFLVLV